MQTNESPDTPSNIELPETPETVSSPSEEQSEMKGSKLDPAQKKRIITVLFGRLIKMHKTTMHTLTFIHIVLIILTGLHMLLLGTIDSENNSCFLTWPLMHLFYMFVNYVFAWFYCYNACEIAGKRGLNSLTASKRFLKVLFLFGLSPIPLRLIAISYCRNWTISLQSCAVQSGHILFETLFMFIYFSWFERKYKGFRIFYRESIV